MSLSVSGRQFHVDGADSGVPAVYSPAFAVTTPTHERMARLSWPWWLVT